MNFRLPDSHGWVTAGLYALTVMVFFLMAYYPDLRHDDLFKTLSQAVVITGLVNLALSFYFGASKVPPKSDVQPPPPGNGGQS